MIGKLGQVLASDVRRIIPFKPHINPYGIWLLSHFMEAQRESSSSRGLEWTLWQKARALNHSNPSCISLSLRLWPHLPHILALGLPFSGLCPVPFLVSCLLFLFSLSQCRWCCDWRTPLLTRLCTFPPGGHPGCFTCGLELTAGLRSSSEAATRLDLRSLRSLCASQAFLFHSGLWGGGWPPWFCQKGTV